MRKLLSAAIFVATLGLMATVPSVNAFHGSPYTAEGTATIFGKVFDAKVVWTGNGAGGVGTYRIYVKDPATGLTFYKTSLSGRETFTNIRFVNEDGCGSLEIVDYLGEATVDPDTNFRITGFQKNNLCTGRAYMEYHGHHLRLATGDQFNLDLVVWTAL